MFGPMISGGAFLSDTSILCGIFFSGEGEGESEKGTGKERGRGERRVGGGGVRYFCLIP